MEASAQVRDVHALPFLTHTKEIKKKRKVHTTGEDTK